MQVVAQGLYHVLDVLGKRPEFFVDRQNVKVASKGDLVVLIMDNELADKILENFNNL